MESAWKMQARPRNAHRVPPQSPALPDDDGAPRDQPPDPHEPTPPMPKIPPRPLDWPPDAGVPVPDQPPAGMP